MLKCFKKINKKDTGVFAAGLLLGTAGIKLLSSKDAKKLYTNCTAAVLVILYFIITDRTLFHSILQFFIYMNELHFLVSDIIRL